MIITLMMKHDAFEGKKERERVSEEQMSRNLYFESFLKLSNCFNSAWPVRFGVVWLACNRPIAR